MKYGYKEFNHYQFLPKNVIHVFRESTIDEFGEGVEWYKNANRICKKLSRDSGVTFAKACGVFAGLSPNNHVATNESDARRMLNASRFGKHFDVTVSTYDLNKFKSASVIDCPVNSSKRILEIIKGKKVQAFYKCIKDVKTNKDSVCIDGHAKAIAMGVRFTVSNPKSNVTPKQYDVLVDCYKTATNIINRKYNLNLLPFQVQAVTWVTWRRLNGIK